MSLVTFLGLGAAFFQAVAYLDYNKKIWKGDTTPNSTTWLIWAFLAGFNLATYLGMTIDWAKSALPIVNLFLCVGTFLLVLYLGKFEWPDIWDALALVLGLVAVIFWWLYQSAAFSNIIIQGAIFLGFIPTYRSVWEKPEAERFRPWWIWAVAYIVMISTISLSDESHWQDFVYPGNCLVLHCFVPGVATLSSWFRARPTS